MDPVASLSWADRLLVRLTSKLEFDGVDYPAMCAALTRVQESHWERFPNECLGRLVQHAWSNVAWIEMFVLLLGLAMFVAGTSCCMSNCCVSRFAGRGREERPRTPAMRKLVREIIDEERRRRRRRMASREAGGGISPSSDSGS